MGEKKKKVAEITVSRFRGTKTVTALVLVFLFIGMTLVLPQDARAEWDHLELVPSKYTGTNVYAPGETMDIILQAEQNDVYDVYVQLGELTNSVQPNVLMERETKKVPYTIPENTPDGNYSIFVTLPSGNEVDRIYFIVQGYRFQVETNRDAYLSGDYMTVFWTANNIKDQTLPPNGIGIIRLIRNLTNENTTLYVHTFSSSAGSISFELQPSWINYLAAYRIEGWFNDTATPGRVQNSTAHFEIKRLGIIVDLDKEQYAVGSLLKITVKAVVTENQANPDIMDTPEPNTNITISIWDNQNTRLQYIMDLLTDSHGIIEHIFYLDPEIYLEDSQYIMEVRATKELEQIIEQQTFEISTSSSLAVVLDFNKGMYSSGENMFMNATASSIGGDEGATFTYIMEIRDTDANGSLFSRLTQSNGEFSFGIPINFEGWLWVRVMADDGTGNSASVIQQVEVAYAIVLVNVDKEYYVANEELSISYEVISSVLVDPSTFYQVYDYDGAIVEEGSATGGRFIFTIPAAPSKEYEFRVIAIDIGRRVHGSDTAVLFAGYVLLIDFNRNNYSPGDTMAVDYELKALGDTNLPASFTITFGLANGPTGSLQTSSHKGTLLYVIPTDVDQGEQLFWASSDFGGTVNQVITVKDGANPFWYLTIWDIPLLNFILIFLVLFSLYTTFKYRRKLMRIQMEGVTKPSEPSRRTTPETHAMMTECVECGNPIEITTSRRPIEVMCPHCGEIQYIEK